MPPLYARRRVNIVQPSTAVVPFRKSYKKGYKKKSYGRRRRPMKIVLPKYALAQSNPFDPYVVGVKIPDSSTTKSVGFPDINIWSTTATVAGSLQGLAFFPGLQYNALATAGVGSWTWAAAYGGTAASAAGANIIANFSAIRPVAHGIKIESQLSSLSATGFVHICLFPSTNFGVSTWKLPTTIAQMARLPGYKRMTVSSLTQKSVVYVNKYMDETAYRYIDPNDSFQVQTSGNGFDFQYQWNAIVMVIEGGVGSVSNLEIENLVHYEGVPNIGSSLAVPTSDAEPCNYDVLQRTSKLQGDKDPMIDNANSLSALNDVKMEDTTQYFCDADCRSDVVSGTIAGGLSGMNEGYATGGIAGAIYGGAYGAARGGAYMYQSHHKRKVFRKLFQSPAHIKQQRFTPINQN